MTKEIQKYWEEVYLHARQYYINQQYILFFKEKAAGDDFFAERIAKNIDDKILRFGIVTNESLKRQRAEFESYSFINHLFKSLDGRIEEGFIQLEAQYDGEPVTHRLERAEDFEELVKLVAVYKFGQQFSESACNLTAGLLGILDRNNKIFTLKRKENFDGREISYRMSISKTFLPRVFFYKRDIDEKYHSFGAVIFSNPNLPMLVRARENPDFYDSE